MSAGPPQPVADLLALRIHNDNLALSEDVTCLSCLQHFVLCGWLLRDSGKSLADKAFHQLWCFILFTLTLSFFFSFAGGLEPKKSTYVKSKTRATANQQKEQTRLQLANCKTQWKRFIWHIQSPKPMMNHNHFPHIYDYDIQCHKTPSSLDCKRGDWISFYFFSYSKLPSLKVTPLNGRAFMIGRKNLFMDVLLRR